MTKDSNPFVSHTTAAFQQDEGDLDMAPLQDILSEAQTALVLEEIIVDPAPTLRDLEIQKRQDKLFKIEHDSARMERDMAIKKREAELALREATYGPRPKNFPRCCPLFQHYIKDDIPPNLTSLIRALYFGWFFQYIVLLCNLTASILLLSVSNYNIYGTEGTQIGLSCLYLVILPIFSLAFWYRPVYKAFAKNSSMNYYIFFLFNAVYIVFTIYMSVGMPCIKYLI